MTTRLDEFQSYRTRMNDRIADIDHLGIKRFFNLDTMAYKEGALSAKQKELLGLVASMVLRCNDCIDYHILKCVQAGWKDEELYEAFNVALVVGGSILTPKSEIDGKTSLKTPVSCTCPPTFFFPSELILVVS